MDPHILRANFLKSNGFKPKCILDIGACIGEWTSSIKQVFPDATFVMFEANDKFKNILTRKIDGKTKVHMNCLSDTIKDVYFYVKGSDDVPNISDTGGSYYRDNTIFFTNDVHEKKLRTTTIDEIVKQNNYTNIDFMKLDTQGSELDILKGATETIKNNFVKYILLEMNIYEYNKNNPTIDEIILFMKNLNYSFYDIWNLGYYNNSTTLIYFDGLFIRNFDRKINGAIF